MKEISNFTCTMCSRKFHTKLGFEIHKKHAHTVESPEEHIHHPVNTDIKQEDSYNTSEQREETRTTRKIKTCQKSSFKKSLKIKNDNQNNSNEENKLNSTVLEKFKEREKEMKDLVRRFSQKGKFRNKKRKNKRRKKWQILSIKSEVHHSLETR